MARSTSVPVNNRVTHVPGLGVTHVPGSDLGGHRDFGFRISDFEKGTDFSARSFLGLRLRLRPHKSPWQAGNREHPCLTTPFRAQKAALRASETPVIGLKHLARSYLARAAPESAPCATRTVLPRHLNDIGNPGSPAAILSVSSVPGSGSIASLMNSSFMLCRQACLRKG